MKHLKVRGRLTNDKRVLVTVLEQTHFGNDFGCLPGRHGGGWRGLDTVGFEHNGMLIMSHPWEYMAVIHDRTAVDRVAPIWITLRPSDYHPARHDKKELKITLEEWKQLKEVVKAYNEWGLTQDDKVKQRKRKAG